MTTNGDVRDVRAMASTPTDRSGGTQWPEYAAHHSAACLESSLNRLYIGNRTRRCTMRSVRCPAGPMVSAGVGRTWGLT